MSQGRDGAAHTGQGWHPRLVVLLPRAQRHSCPTVAAGNVSTGRWVGNTSSHLGRWHEGPVPWEPCAPVTHSAR